MIFNKAVVAFALGMFFWALSLQVAFAQSAEELRRLDALEAECFNARNAKFAAAQRRRVEACVNSQDARSPKSREQCEAYWKDYGWQRVEPRTENTKDLFVEFPECKRAFDAKQQYRSR